ncbi:hypothetical protein JYK04_07216 [Streptomyces nojiriensis]|nr:hypothetical protein JYK04_07216 [Streptomyces nojiriensis]
MPMVILSGRCPYRTSPECNAAVDVAQVNA